MMTETNSWYDIDTLKFIWDLPTGFRSTQSALAFDGINVWHTFEHNGCIPIVTHPIVRFTYFSIISRVRIFFFS